MRIGQGYDAHQFISGPRLRLGGVEIEHDQGLKAHSDGDVLIHALCDALLGAAGLGDIGRHFPPDEAQWKGAASEVFLAHALRLAEEKGYRINNMDLTLLCEKPKIAPHAAAMITALARITGLAAERISVKATTTERLGFTGREEGIAAHAVVLLFDA